MSSPSPWAAQWASLSQDALLLSKECENTSGRFAKVKEAVRVMSDTESAWDSEISEMPALRESVNECFFQAGPLVDIIAGLLESLEVAVTETLESKVLYEVEHRRSSEVHAIRTRKQNESNLLAGTERDLVDAKRLLEENKAHAKREEARKRRARLLHCSKLADHKLESILHGNRSLLSNIDDIPARNSRIHIERIMEIEKHVEHVIKHIHTRVEAGVHSSQKTRKSVASMVLPIDINSISSVCDSMLLRIAKSTHRKAHKVPTSDELPLRSDDPTKLLKRISKTSASLKRSRNIGHFARCCDHPIYGTLEKISHEEPKRDEDSFSGALRRIVGSVSNTLAAPAHKLKSRMERNGREAEGSERSPSQPPVVEISPEQQQQRERASFLLEAQLEAYRIHGTVGKAPSQQPVDRALKARAAPSDMLVEALDDLDDFYASEEDTT